MALFVSISNHNFLGLNIVQIGLDGWQEFLTANRFYQSQLQAHQALLQTRFSFETAQEAAFIFDEL